MHAKATNRHTNTISMILLMLSLLFATIDTGLFAYSSLSKAFGFSVFAITMTIYVLLHSLTNKQSHPLNRSTTFIIVWMAFIILHGIAVGAEIYRVCYIISTLIFMLTLYVSLKQKTLNFNFVENCLLAIATIHLAFMIAQSTGISQPLSPYFKVTGANDNPNTTAIYLTGCIPILIKRLKQHQNTAIHTILFSAIILALLTLKCRTAYIGIAVMAAVWLLSNSKLRKNIYQLHFTKKIICCLLCLTIITISGIFMYNIKKESADGRMLIWKISTSMILEKPQGYGYGLFERNYNLTQANYFNNIAGTKLERENASSVSMAYNDYMEQGVEGGVTGLIFHATFYIMVVIMAYKKRMMEHAAIVSAFAVMALFNFICTSILPWILLLCYCADVMANGTTSINTKGKLQKATIALAVCVTCTFLFKNIQLAFYQIKLNKIANAIRTGKPTDLKALDAMEHNIGTSEFYWRTKAYALTKIQRYGNAARCLCHALKYTSSPAIMFGVYANYEMAGKPEKGLKYLMIMANMIPTNLRSRIYLMRYFHNHGDMKKALAMAQEITYMPLKVVSEEAVKIQNEAKHYLKLYATKRHHD